MVAKNRMDSNHKNLVRNNFRALCTTFWTFCCIMAKLSTMMWQFSNYYNGEEQTVIEFKRYNEVESNVYPSIG